MLSNVVNVMNVMNDGNNWRRIELTRCWRKCQKIQIYMSNMYML